MATIRKDALINRQFYHIYSRSIAKFIIFNNTIEFSRALELIDLFRFKNFEYRMSSFKALSQASQTTIVEELKEKSNRIVDIIAYCFMPTHIHLLLRQNMDKGITKFMGRVLNSYSKFFNTTHERSGPLWTSRFKNVLIKKDEQLLHLTRYIHLNPTSAGLVEKPEDWEFSSYREYINLIRIENPICSKKDIFNISPKAYKKFVNDRKSYQRELALIKNALIDNYAG